MLLTQGTKRIDSNADTQLQENVAHRQSRSNSDRTWKDQSFCTFPHFLFPIIPPASNTPGPAARTGQGLFSIFTFTVICKKRQGCRRFPSICSTARAMPHTCHSEGKKGHQK